MNKTGDGDDSPGHVDGEARLFASTTASCLGQNGQIEPDSFVVSGQSQIHGDSNIWISTTSSEPTFSFIEVARVGVSLGHDKDFFDGCSVSVFPLLLIAFRDSFMGKKFAHPPGLEISMVTNTITPRLCWTGQEAFDALCFHPSGEQKSVCSDVTMICELLAFVNTQVRALDFKRNQRWKLCLTASPRRTRTAVSSACLATAAKGSLPCCNVDMLRGHFDPIVSEVVTLSIAGRACQVVSAVACV